MQPEVFVISFRLDPDGYWIASILAVPGCHAMGQTREEARHRVISALRLFFDDVPEGVIVDEGQ